MRFQLAVLMVFFFVTHSPFAAASQDICEALLQYKTGDFITLKLRQRDWLFRSHARGYYDGVNAEGEVVLRSNHGNERKIPLKKIDLGKIRKGDSDPRLHDYEPDETVGMVIDGIGRIGRISGYTSGGEVLFETRSERSLKTLLSVPRKNIDVRNVYRIPPFLTNSSSKSIDPAIISPRVSEHDVHLASLSGNMSHSIYKYEGLAAGKRVALKSKSGNWLQGEIVGFDPTTDKGILYLRGFDDVISSIDMKKLEMRPYQSVFSASQERTVLLLGTRLYIDARTFLRSELKRYHKTYRPDLPGPRHGLHLVAEGITESGQVVLTAAPGHLYPDEKIRTTSLEETFDIIKRVATPHPSSMIKFILGTQTPDWEIERQDEEAWLMSFADSDRALPWEIFAPERPLRASNIDMSWEQWLKDPREMIAITPGIFKEDRIRWSPETNFPEVSGKDLQEVLKYIHDPRIYGDPEAVQNMFSYLSYTTFSDSNPHFAPSHKILRNLKSVPRVFVAYDLTHDTNLLLTKGLPLLRRVKHMPAYASRDFVESFMSSLKYSKDPMAYEKFSEAALDSALPEAVTRAKGIIPLVEKRLMSMEKTTSEQKLIARDFLKRLIDCHLSERYQNKKLLGSIHIDGEAPPVATSGEENLLKRVSQLAQLGVAYFEALGELEHAHLFKTYKAIADGQLSFIRSH